MAGRHKKYQNLFGTSVFYTVKHYQRVWGLSERKTIKRLADEKKLRFRALDEFELKSKEDYDHITEQNKNKAKYVLLSALIRSVDWLEKFANIFWLFFNQPINVYATALSEPIYANNWDAVMHTNTQLHCPKRSDRHYISSRTLKRRFDTEKKELINQVLDDVRGVWKNCSCRSEYNRSRNRKNCACDPTKGESCNGMVPLKSYLFTYYLHDDRFNSHAEIFKFLNNRFGGIPESEAELEKFIEQFLAEEGKQLLKLSHERMTKIISILPGLEGDTIEPPPRKIVRC